MSVDNSNVLIKRALISSWRKEQAVSLAKSLSKLNVSIIASGGTADAIEGVGIKVERISGITGFEDLLGGRVKTLHPAIHASILARRNDPNDVEQLESAGILPLDLVAVDLYPFPSADSDVGLPMAIELIDIGGVALIRAAAKNFEFVSVLSSADQFVAFAEELNSDKCQVSLSRRQQLASNAFNLTSMYDGCIADRLAADSTLVTDKETIYLPVQRQFKLRYGENPHQGASFYSFINAEAPGIASVKQLGGKELSYTNILDLDIALRIPNEFSEPAVTILKHTTPCGIGRGDTALEAFVNARSTDPQSAFGGIVGFNTKVDLATAKSIREGFMEVVTAPGFDEDALKHLKKSKNLRIIEFPHPLKADEYEFKSVWGGMLIQQRDSQFPEFDTLEFVTEKKPTDSQLSTLKFAWVAARYVKSNAIVLTDDHRTIGIGAGQMSRVDAAHLAIWKAGQADLDTAGTVAASDAFFPFRDGLDVLIDAGVTAVIQPGGSIRDREVIDAANERGVAMIFTGRRHFRH